MKRKHYDIVIDTEDYFHLSSLYTLRVGKQTIGYGCLPIRKIAYTQPIAYNDQQSAVLTFYDLLQPITKTSILVSDTTNSLKDKKKNIPHHLEPLMYRQKDKKVIDDILSKYTTYTYKICMHA